MADENDWLSAATEPDPSASEPAAPAVESGKSVAAPALVEDTDKPKRKLDRAEPFKLYKVWKRPVFLQYSYLYDYRHNYYDDVIDYLDRRQRGIQREIPRAQTWAERALRTYTNKVGQSASYEKRTKDISLLSDMRTCARFYNYHSREYMSVK